MDTTEFLDEDTGLPLNPSARPKKPTTAPWLKELKMEFKPVKNMTAEDVVARAFEARVCVCVSGSYVEDVFDRAFEVRVCVHVYVCVCVVHMYVSFHPTQTHKKAFSSCQRAHVYTQMYIHKNTHTHTGHQRQAKVHQRRHPHPTKMPQIHIHKHAHTHHRGSKASPGSPKEAS
jgi:hypothetical protein